MWHSREANVALEFQLGSARSLGEVHVVLDHVDDLCLVLALFVFCFILATFVDFFAAIKVGFRYLKNAAVIYQRRFREFQTRNEKFRQHV